MAEESTTKFGGIKLTDLLKKIIDKRHGLKETEPLIHCLTNPLTANDCANLLLAVGARPIMAQYIGELEEITRQAKALVINIGGITDERINALFLGGKIAREHHIPIIFDPVGAAGNTYRLDLSNKIINQLRPQIIRGNLSEIKALCGIKTKATGVDAAPSDAITDENLTACAEIVKTLSLKTNAVIAATGKIDIIACDQGVYFVKNGTEMLSRVTGTGCMCTSLMGAYCYDNNPLYAALAASLMLGVAGELSAETTLGPGTFKTQLFDYLYTLTDEILIQRSHIYENH